MCLFCAAVPATALLGAAVRFTPAGASPAAGRGAPSLSGLRGIPPPAAGVGLLVLGLALFAPGTLQYKFDVLGFGVCHQLLSHSLIIGGHPLPVCARCTGIYLGTILTLGLLQVLRPRAGGLPSRRLLPLLALLFGSMVVDGINSTAQSIPGGHGLWDTTNLLRIVTGGLAGIALAFILYPMANLSLWHRTLIRREPVLELPYELFGYGAVLAVLIGVALSADRDPAAGWAYWLIALLSMAGLIGLLTLSNLLITMTVTRREGQLGSWRAALVPLSLALLMALVEMLALSALRGSLAGTIAASGFLPGDLPLLPGVR